MDNLEINAKEYSKQRMQELQDDPHGLVITIAIPEISEKHFSESSGEIQPVISVQSGKEGCNPFTVAMAIQIMEKTIEELRGNSPYVAISEELLKLSFRDNGSIKINSKTGEIERK